MKHCEDIIQDRQTKSVFHCFDNFGTQYLTSLWKHGLVYSTVKSFKNQQKSATVFIIIWATVHIQPFITGSSRIRKAAQTCCLLASRSQGSLWISKARRDKRFLQRAPGLPWGPLPPFDKPGRTTSNDDEHKWALKQAPLWCLSFLLKWVGPATLQRK